MGANTSSVRGSRTPSPKSHSSTRERTTSSQRQSRRAQQVVIHQPDGHYMDPTRRHRDHERRRLAAGRKSRQKGPEIVEDPVEDHHRYKVRQTRYKSSDATYMENYERYRAVEDAKRRSGNYERKIYIPTHHANYRGTAIIRDEKPYTYSGVWN